MDEELFENGEERDRFVILVNGGDDRKVQYLTAKEIAKYRRKESFQVIFDKVKAGENVVIQRVPNAAKAMPVIEAFEAVGAKVWVSEQKQISGHDVF